MLIKLFLAILLFPKINNAEEINFLLQNVVNPDKVELLSNITDQNIVSLNFRCKPCFQNIVPSIKNSSYDFIIVTDFKPIGNVIEVLQLYGFPKEHWAKVYYDPGLRLLNSLSLANKQVNGLIRHRKGVFKTKNNINLTTGPLKQEDLMFWKE